MIGFTYNSLHSYDDYNIVAKSVNRPILPALRKRELIIPGRHGTYDFGGNTYDNRLVSVLLQYIGSTFFDLRSRARDIAAWLSQTSYKELSFDDEPDKYYLAKVYDQVELETFLRSGKATINFECQPFAYYVETNTEETVLDSDIPLDSWKTLDPPSAVAVTGATNISIYYDGTKDLGMGLDGTFNITVVGSFTTLSASLNGNTINYTAAMSNKTLIIDSVNGLVTVDGVNSLANCTGDQGEFLKLIPGDNTLAITGTGLNCTVLPTFRPQYL